MTLGLLIALLANSVGVGASIAWFTRDKFENKNGIFPLGLIILNIICLMHSSIHIGRRYESQAILTNSSIYVSKYVDNPDGTRSIITEQK